jgi:CRP-like cAMP-binding protein
MIYLFDGRAWLLLHWQIPVIICVLGFMAMWTKLFGSDQARSERLQQKRRTQMRALADRISKYGCQMHERYPTGDVVVSQRDLAEQLGKSREAVIIALNLLLAENKVERSSLQGYWKLNV